MSLLGKWVLKRATGYGGCGLERAEVLFVHKETAKQVRAGSTKESAQHYCQTVQKSQIIKVVPEDTVDQLRERIKDVQNEYTRKQKELFEVYLREMNGVADLIEGAKYEIDGK